jgi:hypothetical protein
MKVCPFCGSKRIAYIQYGLIGFSSRLEKAIDEKRIILGGCTISGDDPEWHCWDCSAYWKIEAENKVIRYLFESENSE